MIKVKETGQTEFPSAHEGSRKRTRCRHREMWCTCEGEEDLVTQAMLVEDLGCTDYFQ